MTANDPTKARLLEAAGEEFAAKGFEGATIRGICQRAEANVAAVNYYFGDKEGLYTQAVIEAHRCGVALPLEPGPLDGQPAERLREHLRHFLEHILAMGRQGPSWHHELMLRELIRPTAACETLVREVIRPKFRRLLAILLGLRPDFDERRLQATAFSIIGQCLHYRISRPITERLVGPSAFEALDLDYLTDHITGFTLAALGLAPPIGGGDAGREPARAGAEGGGG